MKIIIKTPISKDFRTVFERFNLELFKALKPPGVSLKVTRFDGCKKGDEVHLLVAGQTWVSHISEYHEDENGIYFIDIGVVIPPPIKQWKHKHIVQKDGPNSCIIIDDIEYETGNAFTDRLIYPAMYAMFLLRKPIYKRELS